MASSMICLKTQQPSRCTYKIFFCPTECKFSKFDQEGLTKDCNIIELQKTGRNNDETREKEKRERQKKQPFQPVPKIRNVPSRTQRLEFITGFLKDTNVKVACTTTPLTRPSPYQRISAIICRVTLNSVECCGWK
jgi:hypothetical protein